MDRMTDEQLMDQLRNGDRDSIDELYRRYAKKLYVYFSRVMKVPNPEDLVHDIFIRVIEKAKQFNPKKASFRTWLFRIAQNHSINLYRRQKILKFSSLEQKIGQNSSGSGLHIKDTLEDKSQSADESSLILAVRECIDELKKEIERQALVLYHLFGKNYKEISDVFKKSISAVRKYVVSAEAKVRHCLERKGIDAF
ncbi:MAG: RNA polymerase sigma factor [Candidatus Aminicenantes bacterium]|nr:RNA polymerase sigma factor [Candidatus Aminicenantes bacterium]MDH5385490.1 RNA polymerase sigma factor [Candidatus Aminicenantes bacterium]MDH5742430.1 RNA polymerase sigma factor [Candidatus Aminicenantes bacterium]